MNLDMVLEKVVHLKPRTIYICGKTCTGKTTFTHLLEKEGYARIELDQIVIESVVEPYNVTPTYEAFVTAYQDIGPTDQRASFITAAKRALSEKRKTSPVVVEGSLGKAHLIKAIFGADGTFLFMYFHPTDAHAYADRIRTRFIAGVRNNTSGLPKAFWEVVNEADLSHFMDTDTINEGIENSIKDYVRLSIEYSQERLDRFKADFPHIMVIEV